MPPELLVTVPPLMNVSTSGVRKPCAVALPPEPSPPISTPSDWASTVAISTEPMTMSPLTVMLRVPVLAWTVASPEPSSWTSDSASPAAAATKIPPPSAVATAFVSAVPKLEIVRLPPLEMPPSRRAREVPLNVAVGSDRPTAKMPAAVRPELSASSDEYEAASSECAPEPASVTPEKTWTFTIVESVALASEPVTEPKPLAAASSELAFTMVPTPVEFEPSGFAL